MRLSAPIFQLKRKARRLAREAKIPLHQALDRVARQEGHHAWSLLAQRFVATASAGKLLAHLEAGDLMLLGARPGEGKTLMSLELAVAAMRHGSRAAFFSLEYTQRDILDRFEAIGVEPTRFDRLFEFDCSDVITADYIKGVLASASRGMMVVVDYLQLLDQKRENPELEAQVRMLKSFARERGLIVVLISQIDRSYDPSMKPFPDARDVRLPNPLDLGLFDKSCFLSKGAVHFQQAS